MARRPDPPAVDPGLRAHLDEVRARTDLSARLDSDPIRFPRRYRDPLDAEIAGLIAATYAYGRVSAFLPVLDAIFAQMDAQGGPAAFVRAFDVDREGPVLAPHYYRFYQGSDLVLLLASLQRVLASRGSLQAFFADVPRGRSDGRGERVARGLDALAAELREGSPSTAGFRYMLPAPGDGSACKRSNLWIRWMVRPADGIDLGLWSALDPSELVIPLDTHVLRLSRFLGLTARKDGSWRTAVEVTASLAELDPDDPVGYDFAIAHLGISGACRGWRDPEVCPTCPLDHVCKGEYL
jgi:uncharacterized protein (TIGR02757 family)